MAKRIVVSHVFPPIPVRDFDYAAHWDDDEPNDAGQMRTGYGPTAKAAVADLLASEEDLDPAGAAAEALIDWFDKKTGGH